MPELDELGLALAKFPLGPYVLGKGAVRGARDEVVITCPRCGKDKLFVNIPRRTWHCFVCERTTTGIDGKKVVLEGGGTVWTLVQWLEGLKGKHAADFVFAQADNIPEGPIPLLQVKGPALSPWDRTPTGLPDGCVAVDGTLPYLRRRLISAEDAKLFGLGWVSEGKYAGRIVFPVWRGTECIYWQARAAWDAHEHPDDGSKYIKTLNPAVFYCRRCRQHFEAQSSRCTSCSAPPQFGSSDVLLNIEQAALLHTRDGTRVAITEGPTSCVRVGPSAVATFGKVLHPQQIGLLLKYRVKAVDLLWDGPTEKEPEGARPQMAHAAAQLAPYFDVRCVWLPQGDPGDWPRDALEHFRFHAQPFSGHAPL